MHKHHQMGNSVQMKISKKTSSTFTTPVDCSLVSFFLNLNDAIREDDAARLFRCLLFWWNIITGTLKVLLFTPAFFAKVLAVLSKEEAKRLLANRFFNIEGKRGKPAIGLTENGSEIPIGKRH